MMLPLLLVFIALIEPVNLQGDEKQLILQGPNQPCQGHVQVYYKNKWGYVGDTKWNESTEEVVCRSTHCGTPLKDFPDDIFRPIDSQVWLNELDCKGNESHLWDCRNPGWGISEYRADSVKTIKCSREVEISLDGYTCAGAVRFTTDKGATKGYFCDENWGNNEANLVCRSLKCGESKEIPEHPWFGSKDFRKKSKNMKIKCADTSNLKSLWQCAHEESTSCTKPASVICTGFQRLQLKGTESNVCSGQLEELKDDKWIPVKEKSSPDDWCKQMHCGTLMNVTRDGINVTCSDKVKVVLKDRGRESSCYGEVHFEVNGTSRAVCGSKWTNKEAEMVCRETGCGVPRVVTTSGVSSNNGIMDFVRCSGSESSLWHCLAKRDTQPFRCDTSAYVVCSDSVNVRLVDGPGSCAGRVEIKYQGKWQRVSKTSWKGPSSNTVCRQLRCGKQRTPISGEKFSQGSGEFLPVDVDCQQGASNISECIMSDPGRSSAGKPEAVGITCEKHKVVFLDGKESCSGMVGIEQGDETFWLSGSNETWNQELANRVCQEMQCGQALDFTSTNDSKKKEVWPESYNCTSNSTSLFGCERGAQPSNHGDTIATVQCTGTGNFKVSLTNECWGNVMICKDEQCGSVCDDTWTEQKSNMLCENLKCGRAVLHDEDQFQGSRFAMFKSLHTTKQMKNLNQSNFIMQNKDQIACEKQTAFVICSESVVTHIDVTREKCMGNVKMLYGGSNLPVCKEALTDQHTRDLMCKEQDCGTAVAEVMDSFGPKTQLSGISQITCAADKKFLRECDIGAVKTSCTPAGLQCSKYRKMELKFHTACSGALFVYSEGKRSAVSHEGWTKDEMNRLCEDLQCGSLSSNKTIELKTNDFWNSSFKCDAEKNPKSIWDCEKPSTDSERKQLFIQCSGEPKVTLSGKCGGEVKINNVGVCDSNWDDDYSHLVCQEMGCSNAVSSSKKNPSSNTEYYHVQCEKYHSRLGQCKRFKGRCDGKLVSVHCVKNVKFDTEEKCGGNIQINYRNQWEKVCAAQTLTKEFKDQLCDKLECDERNVSSHIPNKKLVGSGAKLECTEAHEDITYCISTASCAQSEQARVECEGYVSKPKPAPPPPGSPTSLVLGIGFSVLFVILAIIIFGIWIARRTRRDSEAKYAARALAQRELEFEDYDYEDLMRKTQEARNYNQEGFPPGAEVSMESDARSTTSLPYDDIDEAAGETRPLTSQVKAGFSGDSSIPEGAADHSRVTYEGEDFRESYDDIDEVLPEDSQTNADVHDGPGTSSPESFPAPPPGLPEEGGEAEGGKDYLVPGQDW